ncbi:right-handed parallel beta-helix repeat-containing protein [Limosilactobacillus fermentum]
MNNPAIPVIDTWKGGNQWFDISDYWNAHVGDSRTPFQVRFQLNGRAEKLDGLKPFISGNIGEVQADGHITNDPNKVPVSWEGDQSDCGAAGLVTMCLPAEFFPTDGIFEGVIGLKSADGSDHVETTKPVIFRVSKDGFADMAIAGKAYVSEIEQWIDEQKQLFTNGQTDIKAISDSLSDLFAKLSNQGTDTQTLLTTLEAQIKQNGLFTQTEATAFEQLLNGEMDSLTNQVKAINQNSNFFRLADYKTGNNSWQDAMDAILQLSNATFNIALPTSQTISTDITIKKPGVALTGGTFAGAKLVLDYPSASSNTMCSVTDVRFSGGNDAIELVSAPYVRVANNYFENTGVAVKVASDVNKDGFQPSRRVIITGNHFNGCSYGFYATDATNTFGAAGDVIFTGNQVDVKVGGIHSENVDGHIITNNVFYLPGNAEKDMNKLDNIYLQNAHFTIIQGNSCFEAGRNGIRLVDCTNVSVLDNQIDWPGQNTPGSGIYIDYNLDGEIMGHISGNQIVYPTKYGVETPTSHGTLDVSDNMIVATGDNRYYYGSSSLDDFAPHYNVYAPNISGSKFSHNFSFAVNNNQSQWLISNTIVGQNYFDDILNYSGRVSNKDFSRSNVVYRAVLHSNLSASYQMTKDDFDTKVGGPDVGAYMIYIIPWGESATAEVYIAAYSGGITTQGSLTQVFGGQSKTQISVEADKISFTGTGLIVITTI